MDFDLYSLGDGGYLSGVLNAVAAMGGSGTYTSLASISILIGIVMLGIQAAFTGGKGIQFQYFLSIIFVYQVMFGVTATVHVEDVYSGEVHTVANVPFGLAFLGSTMSSVGYELTETMETAFSTPGMSEDGFGGSLMLLLNTRRIQGLGRADKGCGGTPPPDSSISYPDSDCSVELSLSNYIRDCIGAAVDRGVTSQRAFEEEPSLMAALNKGDLPAYTTNLYIWPAGASGAPPSGGFQATCSDAYSALNSRLTDGTFTSELDAYAIQQIRGKEFVDLESALATFGTAGLSAQDLVLSNAARRAYENALISSASSENNAIEAMVMTSAIEQRNTQWAAEASLFSRYVRPMVTFFESLTYATAPFVVFLLGLGPMGAKIAIKYLYLPIWVNLWLPVMAIVNFYANYVAGSRLDALQATNGVAITSLYGSLQLQSTIQDWIGTAGMLASSVPVLTGSLLYGGAVAMSSLASRVTSGDTIDEKVASPSVASSSAGLATGARFDNSSLGGVQVAGAGDMLGRLSVGSEMNSLAASQQSWSSSASAKAGQEFGRTFTSSQISQLSTQQFAEIGKQFGASNDSTVRQAYNNLVKASQDTGSDYTTAQADAARMMFDMGIEGHSRGEIGTNLLQSITNRRGRGGGRNGAHPDSESISTAQNASSSRASVGASAKAGVTASESNDTRTSQQAVLRKAYQQAEDALLSSGGSSSLNERLAIGLGSKGVQAVSDSLEGGQSDRLTRAISKAEEESEQYQTASNAAAKFSSSGDMKLATFAVQAARQSDVMDRIRKDTGRDPDFGVGDTRLMAEMDRVKQSMLRDRSTGVSFFVGNQDAEDVAAYMIATRNLANQDQDSDKYLDKQIGLMTDFGISGPSASARKNANLANNGGLADRADEAASQANRETGPVDSNRLRQDVADSSTTRTALFNRAEGITNHIPDDPSAMHGTKADELMFDRDRTARQVSAQTREQADRMIQNGSWTQTNAGPQTQGVLMGLAKAEQFGAQLFSSDQASPEVQQRIAGIQQGFSQDLQDAKVPVNTANELARQFVSREKGETWSPEQTAASEKIFADDYALTNFSSKYETSDLTELYERMSPEELQQSQGFGRGLQEIVSETKDNAGSSSFAPASIAISSYYMSARP